MITKTNLRDSYKHYKKNSDNPVDVRIYLYIVTGFIKFIMAKVFAGYDVELSAGRSLGTIGIRGKRPKPILDEEGNVISGYAVDWKRTNELRKSDLEAAEQRRKVYHLNEHSNGISYNLRWWQEGMITTNKTLYCLLYCKPNKRKVVQLIFEGKEYLVK